MTNLVAQRFATMTEPRPRTEHWAPNPDPSSIIVPGVDSAASFNDQIDQIDQLITIRLQNIDANFSRAQHIISSKLLPAFKRYAEGTESVREAAKFWKSFYEAAAQVRIPIANDTSSMYPTDDSELTSSEPEEDPDKTAMTNVQDDSFVRGAPVSSTPLPRDPAGVALPRDSEEDDSWTASIESPFERLGRQVKDLTLDSARDNGEGPSTSSAPSFSPMHGSYTGALPHAPPPKTAHPPETSEPTSQIPHSLRKGKSPLRQNILRQNAAIAAASDAGSTHPRPLHTPRHVKTPKNPFLPPHSLSRQWNGLVDLRQPSPARQKVSRAPQTPQPSQADDYDSDSSDDLFPAGMSPPVTMQFAMPSRVQRSTHKLALTPARKAAERIGRDLVANAAARGVNPGSPEKPSISAQRLGGEPSISSVAPSLPSLSRYSVHSASAHALTVPERARDQIEDDVITPVHQIYGHRPAPEVFGLATGQPFSQEAPLEDYLHLNPEFNVGERGMSSPDSDSDSKSSEHDESNPSAAFLFATQNNARAQQDDSFASSQHSMSSDEDEDDVARAARHPLAHIFAAGGGEGGGVEDSFDQDNYIAHNDDEETIFGARQVGQVPGEARLRIMRHALIDDTYPGAPNLNPFAQVEQSPTPYSGDAEEFL